MVFVKIETIFTSLFLRGQNDDRRLLLSFRLVLANPFQSFQGAFPSGWKHERKIGTVKHIGAGAGAQREERLQRSRGGP
jgi:hypothetical protein